MPRHSDQKPFVLQRRRARGASTLEAIVAFTLLGSVLAMATPLVVRHGRLLTSHRDYQLALEELDNHLDRLTVLPEAERSQALEALTPSPLAAAKLPGAKLQGVLEPAQMGQRLTLRLSWDAPQGRTTPVCLAAWIFPDSPRPLGDQSKEDK